MNNNATEQEIFHYLMEKCQTNELFEAIKNAVFTYYDQALADNNYREEIIENGFTGLKDYSLSDYLDVYLESEIFPFLSEGKDWKTLASEEIQKLIA